MEGRKEEDDDDDEEEEEEEMHERRRHGRRMNGTKEEMHIYLVAWPTKKFNPERSTATTRKRGDAEEQWPRRRSCNVLILRLSWLCTRSGIPSRKRREVAGLSLSPRALFPPVGKARWRKQSTRYTRDVTDTCSRATSRDRFRRVDIASLVFPNLCISRMKGYFYPKLIMQKISKIYRHFW